MNDRIIINPSRRRQSSTGFSPPTRASLEFHRRLPDYAPTPLRVLTGRDTDDWRVLVKDESERLGLPAFKILGGSFAIYRMAQDALGFADDEWTTWDDLVHLVAPLRPRTLVTATDGNHGRGVARVAKWFGFDARIFMPAESSAARVAAIRSEGAAVKVVDGSYDDAVERARELAAESGNAWLVQDTSATPDEERVAARVIDGYATMLWEIEAALRERNEAPPDVVVVQIGVGSLAVAVIRHALHHWPEARLIGVEPPGSACAFRSIAAGAPVNFPGPHRSIMAGLNCGSLASVAWPTLRDGLDAVALVTDDECADAMRRLAENGITAGESGAAGLAGLDVWTNQSASRPLSESTSSPTALVINTEGATDPENWRRIVGESA